jgi:large subunit ribosomal protein L18
MTMSNYIGKRVRRKRYRRQRAHLRVRARVAGTAERPRLAVFKSLKHIYAQVIDDQAGRTLAQASTLDGDVKAQIEKPGSNVDAAKAVGAAVADRAKAQGIEAVVFDRGGYIYHGKVKALADAAREKGLRF